MKSPHHVIAIAIVAATLLATLYPQFALANSDCLPNDSKPICQKKQSPPEPKFKVCKSGKIVKAGESCGADGEPPSH